MNLNFNFTLIFAKTKQKQKLNKNLNSALKLTEINRKVFFFYPSLSLSTLCTNLMQFVSCSSSHLAVPLSSQFSSACLISHLNPFPFSSHNSVTCARARAVRVVCYCSALRSTLLLANPSLYVILTDTAAMAAAICPAVAHRMRSSHAIILPSPIAVRAPHAAPSPAAPRTTKMARHSARGHAI